MQHYTLQKELDETGWRLQMDKYFYQFIVQILPILFSLWITITITVYTIRRYKVLGAKSFAIVLLLEAIWTTGYLFEITSKNLEWKVFWDNVQWLPSLLIPLFFLSFTYRYSKKDFANPLKMWAILSIIPFITLALIFTNSIHGWAIISSQIITKYLLSEYIYTFGIPTWVGLIYSYIVLIWAITMLLRHAVKDHGAARIQHLIILAGVLIPILGTILSTLNISIGLNRDLSPYTFAISNIIIAIGLFRFRIFGMLTAAKDRVVDEMADGVIILDKLGRILDINSAAKEIIDLQYLDTIGYTISSLFPEIGKLIEINAEKKFIHKEIEIIQNGKELIFDVRITRIKGEQGEYSGWMMILRDITDSKNADRFKEIAFSELENVVRDKTEELSATIAQLEEEITERRLVEEVLRNSETKFRSVIEQSSDAFQLINSEGRIIETNPAFEKLTGLLRINIIGKYSWDLLYEMNPPESRKPENRERIKTVILDALKTGSSPILGHDNELRIQHPDRSMRDILQTVFIVKTDEGNWLGTVVRDITEQKKLQAESIQNSRNLNEINALAIELTGVDTLDLLYKTVAEKVGSVTGAIACVISQYESEDESLVIENIAAKSDIIKQAIKLIKAPILKMRLKISKEKKALILEERFGRRLTISELTFGAIPEGIGSIVQQKLKIGEMIVVSLQLEGELIGSIALFLPQGKPFPSFELLNTIANVVSVSIRRKKLEQELRESEERFREMFKRHNAIMLLISPDSGMIIDANQAASNFYCYSEDDLRSMHISRINPLPGEQIQENFQKIVTGQEKVFLFPNRLANGEIRTVEVHSTLIKEKNGRVLFSVVHDVTDRIKAESQMESAIKSLRESDEKMQSIFRVAPTGIGVVKDRVLLYVNPKISEMIGYSQEELIGQSARILYPSHEEFDFVGREKYRQIADHDTGSVETVWQRKDGSLINIILASTPIDLKDLSKGVTFTALDITDRKRSEKALRISEERYRKIFEASEIGISTNDLNGHFTSGNPALLKMFGYTLDEYCNLTIKDISHPEDFEKDLRLSEELLAGKRHFFTIEKRNRHKNGHYIWGQLTSMLVRDGTGNPLYALGMFEDITKRKEALETLHEHEKFIQTVIETVPVGIFVVDKEGKINYLNPTGQKIWHGAQLVGVDELDIYKGWRLSDGSLVKAHEWGSAKAVLYGQTTLDEEIEIEAFDGTHKIISNSGIPLYDDKGDINGAVAILQDITERKKVEKELLQSSEDLKAAYTATLQGWSHALELREHETAGHSQRVVQLTIEIARKFNFSDEEILHIQRGALLHDIGKMGIPDSILLKPGPLTESEWAVMRMHPVFAKQLLSGIPYLKHAMEIPYYHHERWNGSGYPHGLKGEEIPLAARIFAVIDVWDALNSDRPYRKGWEVKQIFNYLKENSGVLLDPDVVKVFLEIVGN
jgi:PAS domain S-box-containing protein